MTARLAAERDTASNALDAEGTLTLPRRRALWHALYPDTTTEQGRTTGHRRLVLLDILAVQHVLPIWHAVFADDDTPRAMLHLALDVAFDRIDPALAERRRDAAYVDIVENRHYAEDQQPALFAGHASVATVTTALHRAIPDTAATVDDPDLDPESFEPSFLAAAAAAGGLPWSPRTDPRKRHAFWSWYLETAIPRACDLARSDHPRERP